MLAPRAAPHYRALLRLPLRECELLDLLRFWPPWRLSGVTRDPMARASFLRCRHASAAALNRAPPAWPAARPRVCAEPQTRRVRRFVQTLSATPLPPEVPAALAAALAAAPERYNVATHQPAWLLWRTAGGGWEAGPSVWGLVPRWSRTPRTAYTTVTTRLDRAPRNRISRTAWEARQRAVLPFNGYYKWDRTRRPYRPWFVHARDGGVLLAAALWERWRDPETAEPLHSFTVLTREERAVPPPLTPDGPVLLDGAAARRWLDDATWFPQAFLQRRVAPSLAAYPVSRAVQDAARDDYTLLEPAPAEAAETGAGVAGRGEEE